MYRTTSEIRKQTGKALDDSKKLASERAVVDTITANRNLNDQLADFKAKGDAAAAALKAQTYANGVSKEAADKAKERLQKQVDLRNKTEGLRSNPLSDTATQAEREARKAQIDSLLDNSFEPKGRPKPVGGGSSGGSGRASVRDSRSILNDNLESGLKQEKIQLGRELIEIETALAAQTISMTGAMEQKNQATMASLEIERLLIEASLADAEALGDQVQVKKFKNDLDENALKLEQQQKKALLDTTVARTTEKNAIKDLSISSKRYVEDLQFEQIALDKTAQEVAQLRIEREQLRAVEDLKRRVDQNQVDPEVAKAERAAIDARAAAQLKEEEFQRSFVGGWKKAYKKWADNASSEYQRTADTFDAVTRGMDSALDEFVRTGKISFSNLAKSIIADIAMIEARALAAKATSKESEAGGLGGIFSGVLGMFGGGGSAGTSGGTISGVMVNGVASMAGTSSAKGNVFSGSPSLHAYANTVQTSPKTFAFQNLHGFARGGVFAEAGPEAVMPLKRDSAGRLGVQSEGSGSTINVYVTVNAEGGAEGLRRSAGQIARQVGTAVSGVRKYA